MPDNNISRRGKPRGPNYRLGDTVMSKKSYSKPDIRTESLQVGVYGDYGADSGGGDDGGCWNPIHILNPLFHWCCS